MGLYMDVHRKVDGLTADGLIDAHKKDIETQNKFGVKYLKYWFNEADGTVFCLSEGPNREAVDSVHKEGHGLAADEIIEVKEGQ